LLLVHGEPPWVRASGLSKDGIRILERSFQHGLMPDGRN
jgi:hypothetical protein